MMHYENPYDRREGMLARLRGLAVAFAVMMLLTFSIVGFMTGMLLMSESFDDTRQAGLDAWNSDVRDWNDFARTKFQALGGSLTVNAKPLQPSHKNEIYELLMQNDGQPEELLKPDALYFTIKEDISQIKAPQPGSSIEVVVGAGAQKTALAVPMVFIEVRCRYVQRGKMSRQVCEDHFFVLQEVCIKVDAQGVPSRTLDGVTGASTDVGCFVGTEGMYRPRLTNIWSPGIYKEFSDEGEATFPKELQIEIRSNTDPALTASVYTAGYYDFGQSPADKFYSGLIVFILSSIVLCIFISMCTLQYIWPQAGSYSERMKYFYRRYLRQRHAAFNEWWARNFGGEHVAVPEVSTEELLVMQQAAQAPPNESWQGPREGGHRLGGPMPPLHAPHATV
jgi:hypothetical protein